MSNRRKPNSVKSALDSIVGSRMAGGCDDCTAEQVLSKDGDGMYRLVIEHDPTCPELARIERGNQ